MNPILATGTILMSINSEITYSTNWMGPHPTYYTQTGIPHDSVAGGRLDIYGLNPDEHYNGQSEYGIPFMHRDDWVAFSEWVLTLTTDTVLPFETIISMFEESHGKIRWVKI